MGSILLQILPLISQLSVEEKQIVAKELNISSDAGSAALIADIASKNSVECPHCHGKQIIKWGPRSGGQRYKCKSCNKTFNSLTKTPLAYVHYKRAWLDMCQALDDGISVRKTAEKCHIAVSTAFFWRHRWIKAIAAHDSDTLNDIGEMDEMYFPRSYKGSVPEGRESRHRGACSGKGLDGDKVGVLFALDRQGHEIASVLQDHTSAAVAAVMQKRLEQNCVLCLDGGSALIGYASKSGHDFKVTSPGRYIYLPDPHYHIQTVNAAHSAFRGWMKRFRGVATKYLQNYVGWMRCMQTMLRNAVPMAWLRNCIVPAA